jgi:hypothetical protein
VREALVRGFDVIIDLEATGAGDIHDPRLGSLTADEVRRTAFLQLVHMGASLIATPERPAQAPSRRAIA